MSFDTEAFNKGYADKRQSLASAEATSFSASIHYQPPDGFVEPYAAGWRKAEEEAASSLTRSERRNDILVPFVVGLLFLTSGLGFTYFTIKSGGDAVVIAYGAIISGLGFLARGFVVLFRRSDVNDTIR